MDVRKNRKHFSYHQYEICLVPRDNKWYVNVCVPSQPLLYRFDRCVGTSKDTGELRLLLDADSAMWFTSIAECLYEAVRLIKEQPPEAEQISLIELIERADHYSGTASSVVSLKSLVDDAVSAVTNYLKKRNSNE